MLHTSIVDEKFTAKHGLNASQLQTLKNSWHFKLLTTRDKRKRPHTDNKVLVSWNALLINGYVNTYKAFGTAAYIQTAKDILKNLQKHGYTYEALGHS